MHLKNLHNEYASALGPLFEEMPKAVLAAVAVSALTIGGDEIDQAAERVAREWCVLHQTGIVPQRPTRRALQLGGETIDLMAALKKSLNGGSTSG